jgi:hypothetical protein
MSRSIEGTSLKVRYAMGTSDGFRLNTRLASSARGTSQTPLHSLVLDQTKLSDCGRNQSLSNIVRVHDFWTKRRQSTMPIIRRDMHYKKQDSPIMLCKDASVSLISCVSCKKDLLPTARCCTSLILMTCAWRGTNEKKYEGRYAMRTEVTCFNLSLTY